MLEDGMDILVVGLGASGEAVVRYCLEHAAADDGLTLRVTAADSSDDAVLQARAEKLRGAGATVVLGVEDIPGPFDLAIMSPGVPPATPIFASAQRAAAQVVSEIEFAYQCSRAPWIAVTGTNGKTTVTSLVGHLLTEAGIPARVVGNIGLPAISVVDETGDAGMLVAEVSSFQLALTKRFCPRIAVLLNITADHLDWHGDFDTYTRDKAKIFSRMSVDDTAVIDVDDPGSAALADPVAARGVRVVRVTRRSVPADGAGVDEDGYLVVSTSHGHRRLLHRDELAIRGPHNVSNACAAAAAALACGVTVEDIARGLTTFRPLEHRLEPAGVVGDVEYYNDSKATNPDATIKALESFEGRELVVLLGGRTKGASFDELAAVARELDVRAVLFGEAAADIATAFDRAGVIYERAGALPEAVKCASGLARPGGVVLLSPACASFDQFTSYVQRGRTFKDAVESLFTVGTP